MTGQDHWLDRAAAAISTPRTSPPIDRDDRDRPSPESLSRSELLRSAAQHLPHKPPPLDPAWSADTTVRRATVLRMIAALGAALAGSQLIRPTAAKGDAACNQQCFEMYDKALVSRINACDRYDRVGEGESIDFFLIPNTVLNAVVNLFCAASTPLGARIERKACLDDCAKRDRPRSPAPPCSPPAKSAHASAACPYAQLPPPPPLSPPPPTSNCGASSCEQVGGLCCGPYATVSSTGGCVTNCSECKNPYLGPC